MARVTPQQARENALVGAVGRSAAVLGLNTATQIAEYTGMSLTVFCKYRKKNYQSMNFDKICRMARMLKFTGREWCAAAGIPYEE